MTHHTDLPGEAALKAAVHTFRPHHSPDTPSPTHLWHILRDRTNIDELRSLCFTLHLDYDTLPGSNRSGKARELVAYFDRRHALEQLGAALTQLRPDIVL